MQIPNDVRKIYLKDLRKENINNLLIPMYQRNYTWQKDNIKTFINDIYENDSNLEYFIGTIILQNANWSTTFSVLDGQQRLSTILLIMRVLEFKYNQNYEIDAFNFKSMNLEDLNNLNEIIHSKNLEFKKETQNYYVALKIINETLNEIDDIKKFIHNFNKTFACFVFLSKDINQYKVFSSINATGKKLSTLELLKPFLLSKFEDLNIKNIDLEQNKLENLFYNIKNLKLKDDKSDEIIRYFIAFKTKTLLNKNSNSLFKGFIDYFNKIDSKQFLNELNEFYKFATYYFYLVSENFIDEFQQMLIIEESLDTFCVLIIDVLMFYSEFKNNFLLEDLTKNINLLKKEEINEVLIVLEYYKICLTYYSCDEKRITRHIPVLINKIKNKNKYAKELFDILLEEQTIVFVNDLIKVMCEKPIYKINNSLLKKFFLRLEYFDNNHRFNKKTKISIEHIFPQNSEKWDRDDLANSIKLKPFLHTLCNLTILEKNTNTNLSNAIWQEKKKFLFKKNAFSLNNILLTYENWNIQTMNNRLNFIVEKIQKIWNFSNLNDKWKQEFINSLNYKLIISNLNPTDEYKTYNDHYKNLRWSLEQNPFFNFNYDNVFLALKLKLVDGIKNIDKALKINSEQFFIHSLLCLIFSTNSIRNIQKFSENEFNEFVLKNKSKINEIIENIKFSDI